MNILQGNIDANLEKATGKIIEAANSGAELICLPEAFATGINFMQLHKVAQNFTDSKIVKTISNLAKEFRVYIIAGVVERTDDNKIFDTAVIINESGEIENRYRRRVLWSGEINFLDASNEEVSYYDTKFGKIGIIIGYEIFFPSLCKEYFRNDVVLIVCIANIFNSLKPIVPAICQSRAFENQCYFVFVSSIGTHTLVNDTYMGGSSISCNLALLPKRLIYKGAQDNFLISKKNSEEIIYEALHLEALKCSKDRFYNKDFERYYSNL